MGARRVTPQEIVEMNRLYAELGTYAAVDRKIGRSGSTVARYIQLKGTPKIVKHTFKEVVRA
ncbi:MAG: helix-turn-helix domain-containing protein [Eubacteriales bacterium]|nr:helix-turn-helix domain-containing protein [Eubacteriales bacterium]